jgi:hypothetical protein
VRETGAGARLRGALIGLRFRALGPVLSGQEDIRSRLESLSRRLDDIETLLQTTEARTSTVTEKAAEVSESQVRTARRVAEIERILGGGNPET